ncbi:MAG TPA: hypothetical protein PKL29_07820 [Methanothrix sp.]|nr:hypothetical protein [Methanothrix sp.]
MPNPTKSDVHVNRLLGNISVATVLKATMFVAADLAPVVPVEFKSDRYAVYDKGDWLRDEALPRAAGTESAGGGWDIDTTPNYSCIRYSFHKDVDDETANNSERPIDMDRDATKFVTQKMLLKRERVVMASFLNTGIWANERSGIASSPTASQFIQWDLANSHPLVNVEAWKELIGSVTGFDPNVMLLSPNVLACLKNHADIKDCIKYTSKGVVTTDLLAELFGVDKVIVPKAVVNTASKGASNAVARVVTNKVWLGYAAPEPSLMAPTAAYIFAWTGLFGNSKIGTRIKKFRIEEIESERIEGDICFDAKVVAPDMACLATSVLATP